MLGGYQILDLRSIDLSRGSSEASITDTSVLAQLLNIRDHIQKTYDFGKPLHAQLKPLLIRYRDKKVGEKHEVACYGNIEVINTYYKFRIIANNEGEQLTINVEFEEKTDEYSNKYWDIKTAKILLTIDETIGGDLTVTGSINGEENPSVKPIYWHTIKFQRGGNETTSNVSRIIGTMIILSNSPEPITLSNFTSLLATEGFIGVVINGKGSSLGGANLEGLIELLYLKYKTSSLCTARLRDTTTNVEADVDIGFGIAWVSFEDLGANKIN